MSGLVLILGATGLLGHQVFFEAKNRFGNKVHGAYRTSRATLKDPRNFHQINLLDTVAVKHLVGSLKPQVIINCAGIVKRICTDPNEAVAMNAELPHLLSRLLDEWGGRLVQISTDCVFTGKRGNYSETNAPDADDLYGKTKIMGEVTRSPHLTVRTSFIGHELETDRGLLAWFLKQKGRVQGFRKVIWSGVTNHFAAGLLNDFMLRPDIMGLLNVSGEPIDKYSLLRAMAEVFDKRDVEIVPMDQPAEDKSLNNYKLHCLGFRVPPIKEMLSGLKVQTALPR